MIRILCLKNKLFSLMATYKEKLILRIFQLQKIFLRERKNGILAGKTILVTPVGGSLLSLPFWCFSRLALKLRGAKVISLDCTGLPIGLCYNFYPNISSAQSVCEYCKQHKFSWFNAFGIKIVSLDDVISKEDRNNIIKAAEKISGGFWDFKFVYNGIDLSAGIRSSIIRMNMTDYADISLTDIKRSAITSAYHLIATLRAIQEFSPDIVIGIEPSYQEHFGIVQLCHKMNIPFAAFSFSFCKSDFTLQWYKHPNKMLTTTLTSEDWEQCQTEGIDQKSLDATEAYLTEKYSNRRYTFFDEKNKNFTIDAFYSKYNIDPRKKTFVFFPHLLWDGHDCRFFLTKNLSDWTVETIRAMAKNTSVNWLLRFHPAEYQRGTPQQKTLFAFCMKELAELPQNITLIPNEDCISTEDLFNVIDGGITGFGTVGLELACRGKIVLTAIRDNVHYLGKGFTYDSTTLPEFLEKVLTIHKLPSLTEKQQTMAKLYLNAYIYRRSIHWNQFSFITHKIDSYNLFALQQGKNDFIDFACECLAQKKNFLLPQKLVQILYK